MPPTDTFDLVDRIVPGGLLDYLTSSRDEGLSLAAIARKLDAEHDVSVSVETMRKWCQRLDISTERMPS